LAPASSFPAIAVTVNIASSASSPLVNSVSVAGGGSTTSITATDSAVIVNSTGTPSASAVSAILIGGATLSQTFQLHYSDAAGVTDLSTVWVWFGAGLNPGISANSCVFYYNRSTNQLYLENDPATQWVGPAALGSAGTLANSQCSVNLQNALVSGAGSDLLITLPMTFMTGFLNAKNIFMLAAGGNANSGWQNMGTWTAQ
jgi:hypothetical protein